jgi:hypothetical protein
VIRSAIDKASRVKRNENGQHGNDGINLNLQNIEKTLRYEQGELNWTMSTGGKTSADLQLLVISYRE